MDCYLQGDTDDSIVTPETLAWKVLMDDNIEDYAGVLLPFVVDNDQDHNTQYDNLAGQFEMLITIYMEMVFGLLMVNHMNSYMNEDGELEGDVDFNQTFNPNFTEYDISDLTDIFREKLKKIRVFLSVQELWDANESDPRDFGSGNEYYCKIILKDLPEGKTYFWQHRKRLDPEKRYTFTIRNDEDKKQKKLDDFYAVCDLPGKKVRISFSLINVITKNPHMV